jgi:pyridoxine 4-dehydrogenase
MAARFGGTIDALPRARKARPGPSAELRAELDTWIQRVGRELLAPAVLLRGVISWSRLHGLISLELDGHVTSMQLDAELLYRTELVLDRDVDRVLRSNQAALESGKPCLHEEHERRANEQPADVDRLDARHGLVESTLSRLPSALRIIDDQLRYSLCAALGAMTAPAHASGTFAIGGELVVHRLGSGAMRLPGVRGGLGGAPAAHELLRETVRLGVDLIDTAHAYGRSEELIAEALHPYPDGLVIATKGGLARGGTPDGRPDRLRGDCEESLRRLRLDTIDVWQLHEPDPQVPLSEQLGAIRELREEGKVRFVGVSNVSLEQLHEARQLIEVATVQNRFNVAEQEGDDVLEACESEGIGFMSFAPIGMGGLAGSGALSEAAAEHRATPAQIALVWLLRRSPVALPIPGTGSLDHLRENVGAASVARSSAP